MTKLLNLDELATADTKTIKLRGIEHPAVEMTVQGYIDRVAQSKLVTDDASDEASNLDRAMALVREVFPSLTLETLKGLTLAQLKAVIDFALAAPEDIAQNAAASAEGNA